MSEDSKRVSVSSCAQRYPDVTFGRSVSSCAPDEMMLAEMVSKKCQSLLVNHSWTLLVSDLFMT